MYSWFICLHVNIFDYAFMLNDDMEHELECRNISCLSATHMHFVLEIFTCLEPRSEQV